MLALVCAAAEPGAYVVVGNKSLIQHVAIVFYSLLSAQCAVSLARGRVQLHYGVDAGVRRDPPLPRH